MEGAALRRKEELNLAYVTAWHTAIFALKGYSGKLNGKSLNDFLPSDETRPLAPTNNNTSDAIAFFHRAKMAGLDVKIERTIQ